MTEQQPDDMSYLQSPRIYLLIYFLIVIVDGNEEPTDPNSMLNYILGFPEKGTPNNDSPQISLGFGNLNNETSPLTRCFSRLEPGSNEEPPSQSLYNGNEFSPNAELGHLSSFNESEPISLFGLFKPLSNTNSPMFNSSIPHETLFSLSLPPADSPSDISQRQQQSINYFNSLTSATQPQIQNTNQISTYTQQNQQQQPQQQKQKPPPISSNSNSFQSLLANSPTSSPSQLFRQSLLNIGTNNNNTTTVNNNNNNNRINNLLDDETKRKKRLERNRESARQSRSKKKEHSIELDEKLHSLITKLCETREEYMMKLRKEKTKNLEKELDIISQYILLNKEEELSISVREFLNNYGTSNNDDYMIVIETINHLIESLLPIYSQFEYWLCSNELSEFENGENFAVGTLGGDVGIRFSNKLQNMNKNNNNNNNSDKNNNVWCKLVSNLSLTAEQEMKLRLDLTSQKNNNNDKRLLLMKIIEYIYTYIIL